MKKATLFKTSAFALVLLMSISFCMIPAYAAGGDDLPAQESLESETPVQEASQEVPRRRPAIPLMLQ